MNRFRNLLGALLAASSIHAVMPVTAQAESVQAESVEQQADLEKARQAFLKELENARRNINQVADFLDQLQFEDIPVSSKKQLYDNYWIPLKGIDIRLEELEQHYSAHELTQAKQLTSDYRSFEQYIKAALQRFKGVKQSLDGINRKLKKRIDPKPLYVAKARFDRIVMRPYPSIAQVIKGQSAGAVMISLPSASEVRQRQFEKDNPESVSESESEAEMEVVEIPTPVIVDAFAKLQAEPETKPEIKPESPMPSALQAMGVRLENTVDHQILKFPYAMVVGGKKIPLMIESSYFVSLSAELLRDRFVEIKLETAEGKDRHLIVDLQKPELIVLSNNQIKSRVPLESHSF